MIQRSKWFVLLVGWGGCPYLGDVTPARVWECGVAQCEVSVSIDVADLVACYGDSANLPVELDDCATAMDDGETDCTMGLEGSWYEGTPILDLQASCCSFTAPEAETCCEALDWELSETGLVNVDNVVQQDCEIFYLITGATCDVEFADSDFVGDCKDGEVDASGYAGAEFEMRIDPASSFVAVDLGEQTVYSSLSGWALVASEPQRVLVAIATGDDFGAFGDAFTESSVYLAAAVQLDGSSNTYVVPPGQPFDIQLRGLRDGEPYALGVGPGVPTGGTFDPAGGVWTYDLNQSGGEGSTVVHLEGALIEVAP